MLSANRHSAILSWLSFTAILIIFWCLAGSSYDQMVLINTVMLGLLASCIAIPLASILAISSSQKSFLGRATLILVLAFALIPIVFQVSCWDAAFGKLGWLTAKWTGTNQPIVSSWVATIWIHAASLTPQIAIFFLAYLPLFTDPALGSVTVQLAILGSLYCVLSVISDGAYAILASGASGWFRDRMLNSPVMRYLTGSIFVGLGIHAALATQQK